MTQKLLSTVREVGGQAVLGRQLQTATPWLTERHGFDPTFEGLERISTGERLTMHLPCFDHLLQIPCAEYSTGD